MTLDHLREIALIQISQAQRTNAMTKRYATTDWLANRLGTRHWVVAARLTERLRAKGYTLAVSQKKFTALQQEYEASLR